MSKKIFVPLVVILLILFTTSSVVAPTPIVELEAYTPTPPTMDGVLGPGEWDAADTIVFSTTNPSPWNKTHILYVMNDLSNLYLAVKRHDETPGEFADWVTFTFDNDGDGQIEDGDDRIRQVIVSSSPLPGAFEDSYYQGSIPSGDGPANQDGSGAAGIDGDYTIFELTHPLDSGDIGKDFQLSVGDTIGFNIDSYDNSHDLGAWPAKWTYDDASQFAKITIAGPTIAAMMPVIKDAYIEADRSTSNFGGYHTLKVRGTSPLPHRTLVEFDLSTIPPGSIISSAYLRLYYYNYLGSDPTGEILWAYQITQTWIEGDEPNITPHYHIGVSWDSYDGYPASNPWATAGGDYTPTDGASQTVPNSYGWMNWTVTDIVKAWIEDGESNFGFLIKSQSESSETAPQIYFASREYDTLDPILEITYSPPIQPTIESCDVTGARKDVFNIGEFVYVSGSGYNPDTIYHIQTWKDTGTPWTNGNPPPGIPKGTLTVTTDGAGQIPVSRISPGMVPYEPGKYDVWIDINNNNLYDMGIDALDDYDVDTAGFFVIPEYWLGTLSGLAIMFGAFILFHFKKQKS